MRLLRFLPLIAVLLFAGCITQNKPIFDLSRAANRAWTKGRVQGFFGHPAQGSAYVNEVAYEELQPSASRMEINLARQRATLYDGQVPVIETPISTGTPEFPTRPGTFKILEKKRYKESNLYGRWVDARTGRTVSHGADSRDPAPPGTVFKGTPVPLWQRVTHDGIGMHVGQLPGYAASHGCIRFPGSVMPLIYEKTLVGTPVKIHASPADSSSRLTPVSGAAEGERRRSNYRTTAAPHRRVPADA